MVKVGIIDYDAGNIHSISKAISKVGAECEVVSSGGLKDYDKLIIPGVGAFTEGMKRLESQNLIQPIVEFAKSGKPILGICLGMQLLTEEGAEFGIHKGLGLIKGRTVSFRNYIEKGSLLPHMGWNSIKRGNRSWDDSVLLNDIPENSEVYFVHSFIVETDDKADVVAYTEYGNYDFVSVLRKDNIFGTQFHPEKSGIVGLKILENFIQG